MSDKLRRNLLKSAALGGAVVAGTEFKGGWIKPMVQSVMLPSHAQTSMAAPGAFFGAAGVVQHRDLTNPLVDALMQEAHAGVIQTDLMVQNVCVTVTAPGMVNVMAAVSEFNFETVVIATNVVVGPDFFPIMDMCQQMGSLTRPSETKSINPGNVLEKLGGIETAHAGLQIFQLNVNVNIIGGTAVGLFRIGVEGSDFPFNLPPGQCAGLNCPAPEPEPEEDEQ